MKHLNESIQREVHKNPPPCFNSDYVDGGKKRRDVKDHSIGEGEEVVSPRL